MKKHNRVATSITAVCALVLSSGIAQAVTTASGDLILGFRATGGQGSASNLEVDLGSLTNFINLTPGTVIDLSSRISLSDLQTTYSTGGTGNSWASRSDLLFSIAATSGTTGLGGLANNTLFASSVNNGGTVIGYTRLTSGTQGTPGGNISFEVAALGGAPNAGTAFSSVKNAGDGGSYTDSITGSGSALVAYNASSSSNFGSPGGAPFENTTNFATNPGTQYQTSDLYQLNPVARNAAPGADLGTFALGNDGSLTFTSVPEPSTYGLMGLGAFGLWFVRRRQRAV